MGKMTNKIKKHTKVKTGDSRDVNTSCPKCGTRIKAVKLPKKGISAFCPKCQRAYKGKIVQATHEELEAMRQKIRELYGKDINPVPWKVCWDGREDNEES